MARESPVYSDFRPLPALLILGALCVYAPLSFPQDSSLWSYEQRFTRAGIAAKADILREAAADRRAAPYLGALYEFALKFISGRTGILKDDPDMIRLLNIAAQGAAHTGHQKSLDTLWAIFSDCGDSQIRTDLLGVLGILGKGNSQAVQNLNQYLDSQNELFRSATETDYRPALTAVAALVRLGDPSSFPVLFAATVEPSPEALAREAAAALETIPGNHKAFLLERILKGPPAEKKAAIAVVARGGRFSPAERGQLAEAALEQGLTYFPGSAGENAQLSETRYASALILTELRWTQGSDPAIRHFYRVQADFQQGDAPRERFFEAVACLAVMDSPDAALALGLQLGLLNARTEQTGEYDQDIILAVVQALGTIGDKSAFDYLDYISYLEYPEHIEAAAKEALSRLRW
jgi:hypothetical protein